MRQRITLVVVTGLALLLPTGIAAANSKQFTTVEAPHELLNNGSPAPALDEIESLGAQGIRIQIPWASVAPDRDARSKPAGFDASNPGAYPAGAWNRFDAAIDGARERGLKVHLTLTGNAPAWATRNGDGLTSPNATEFGKFATAAARRYARKVSWWSIWNEPNLGKLLKPIAGNQSAKVYRGLYLKAYSGLRSGGVRAPILVGELAPQGNGLRDIGTIAPLRFLRSMLCLDGSYRRARGSRCGKVPTQGFAMHPYSTKAGPFLIPGNRDNVTIGVLPRLVKALDRAANAGALPRRLPIYVTEFGVQSHPDKRIGVSPAVQSDYRSIAERIAFQNGRVKSFSQYLLRDDGGTGREYGAFESGLYYNKNRRAKPALQSFRLPLVVVDARGSRDTLWGLVRPARGRRSGRVTLEYKDRGRGWRKLGTAGFSRSGYFKRTTTVRSGRAFRVKWTAPGGTRFTGPATVARAAARR